MSETTKRVYFCSRIRACAWRGSVEELKDVPITICGIPGARQTCPKCGCESFYTKTDGSTPKGWKPRKPTEEDQLRAGLKELEAEVRGLRGVQKSLEIVIASQRAELQLARGAIREALSVNTSLPYGLRAQLEAVSKCEQHIGYYLMENRDGRRFVGNCAFFWRPNGRGYTCRLDDAGIYSEEESAKHRGRPDLVTVVPVAVARSVAHPHCWFEDVIAAMEGASE